MYVMITDLLRRILWLNFGLRNHGQAEAMGGKALHSDLD